MLRFDLEPSLRLSPRPPPAARLLSLSNSQPAAAISRDTLRRAGAYDRALGVAGPATIQRCFSPTAHGSNSRSLPRRPAELRGARRTCAGLRAVAKHNDLGTGLHARPHTFASCSGTGRFATTSRASDPIRHGSSYRDYKLPAEKLWVTCIKPDDEASRWAPTSGAARARRRMAKQGRPYAADNLGRWPDHRAADRAASSSRPGPEIAGGPPGRATPRAIAFRIWNLVFMQIQPRREGSADTFAQALRRYQA